MPTSRMTRTAWTRAPGRPLVNGHSAVAGVGSYQPPAIYTAPVVAEYQRPALQLPRATGREAREERAREERAREERAREERAREERAREERAREERAREERAREERAREERPREDRGSRESVNGEAPPARPDIYAAPGPLSLPAPPRTQRPDRQERPDRPERPEPEGLSGTEAAQASPGQLRRLPSRPSSPAPLGPMGSPPPGPHGGLVSPRTGPYSGPQPIATSPPPGYQSVGGVSLVEAVQAAHEEGQEFGASVARDAPALWLEAVLARKPRMPSDLEARLLQGSALPIDFLLHDEVRHALRRGFWDALERTRR